jgi:hypothetical protein
MQVFLLKRLLVATIFTASLTGLLTGCTVWGAKNPPTLQSTTSAEQYERFFWAGVKSGNWTQVASLLAPNVAYAAEGKIIPRDEIVNYLRSEQIREVIVSDLSVQPNGPDMTLTYHLQTTGQQGTITSLVAVSVWQQLKSGWVLIAHSQQARAATVSK